MNADTCAVLASIFPVVLLTIVLERRGVHLNLRGKPLFRYVALLGAAFSLAGLATSVIGVQLGGLDPLAGWATWLFAGISFVALAVNILGILATGENEDDEEMADR